MSSDRIVDETRVRDYKDLQVWQKGITLVKRIYQLTQSFPGEEQFGLSAQMRKSAVLVPSSIAEGHARTTPEFVEYLSQAQGHIAQLDTQLFIAIALNYCTMSDSHFTFELMAELQRMIGALRRKLSIGS